MKLPKYSGEKPEWAHYCAKLQMYGKQYGVDFKRREVDGEENEETKHFVGELWHDWILI